MSNKEKIRYIIILVLALIVITFIITIKTKRIEQENKHIEKTTFISEYLFEILKGAKKPAGQIKNDIGIDQYGNIVNLDEWCYEITGENTFRTYGVSGYVNSAGYLGALKEVNMPAYIKMNGKIYKLTEIGSMTFSQCTNITSIVIPESVTSIYSYAFERMYKFK